jgi:acetoacetyl-CoA synthetase
MPSSINNDVEAVELWRPSAPEKTEMFKFKAHIGQKYNLKLKNYDDLWQWSISQPAEFWEEVWHYTGVKAHTTYSKVREDLFMNGAQLTILCLGPRHQLSALS